jgi:hypothetical protein
MIVDCARYKDGHRVGEGVMPLEELPDRRAEGGFVWLGLFEPLGRPAGTRQPLSLPDVAGRMFRRGRCAGHRQIQMRFIGRHGQRNGSRARCGLRSARLPGPCPAAAATVDEQAIDRIRDGIQGCPHCTPVASNSCRASAAVNRRSGSRISVSSPSSRSRCSPSRTSCLVANTNRSCAGARISSSSSCRRAWSEPSSCTSSITSHSRSSSGARSASSRSVIAHPSRSGAAVSSRTSADPGAVPRSAATTASHNRCGSRSSRPTGTHAARSARPAAPIHDRSSTVLPRRHHRHPGRRPEPPEEPRMAHDPSHTSRRDPPATASDPPADPMAPIIAPRRLGNRVLAASLGVTRAGRRCVVRGPWTRGLAVEVRVGPLRSSIRRRLRTHPAEGGSHRPEPARYRCGDTVRSTIPSPALEL